MKIRQNIAITLVTIAFFFPIFVAQALVLFTPDSGAYLLNSIELFVPADRPIFYSFYIHISQIFWNNPVFTQILKWLAFHGKTNPAFNNSLFAQVILPASLLIMAEMYLFVRKFFPTNNRNFQVLQLLLIIICTPVSWISIQLMPDIFGAIMALATCNFLVSKSKIHKSIHALILIISASTHNSHILILTLFAITIWAIQHFFKSTFSLKNIQQLLLISFLPWAMIIGSNLYVGNGFTAAKANHVFLMGKWCENGLLNRFIDREKNHTISDDTAVQQQFIKLCSTQNQIPQHAWDFVWNNQPESPLQISGGWHHSKKLYNTIFSYSLTHPYYWPYLLGSAVKETAKQVVLTSIGDGITPIDTNSTLATTLKQHYPKDYHALTTKSKQQNWGIDFGAWNQWYIWVALTINGLFAFFWVKNPKNTLPQFAQMALITIGLFVLINATVTANFANILARLNARFLWLWTATLLLSLLHQLSNYYFNKNQSMR